MGMEVFMIRAEKQPYWAMDGDLIIFDGKMNITKTTSGRPSPYIEGAVKHYLYIAENRKPKMGEWCFDINSRKAVAYIDEADEDNQWVITYSNHWVINRYGIPFMPDVLMKHCIDLYNKGEIEEVKLSTI